MLLVEILDGGQTDAALALQHFGALLTDSGVLGASSFAVSAQVAPDMSVKVSGSDNDDKAVIIRDNGDTYFIKNTADESVTILANTSGVTKTDAIVLYVDLTDGDPDIAGSPGAAKLIAVRRAGVSTGAPSDGEIDTATSNNPWLKLREVEVEHNAGEIEGEDLSYDAAVALISKELIEPLGTDQIESGAVTGANLDNSTTFGVSNKQLLNYVPRIQGSSSYDFSNVPGAWGARDVSAIVGSTAVAVSIYFEYKSTAASAAVKVLFSDGDSGFSGSSPNDAATDSRARVFYPRVTNQFVSGVVTLSLSSDKKFLNFADVAGGTGTLRIVVMGWWEPASTEA